MGSFLFDLFAVFTVVCAAGIVLNRNAVNSAMCLLLCLAGVAALFVKLGAFLLAFLLILVYAGAIVALFLFIIMLLDVKGDDVDRRTGGARIAAGVVAAALVLAGLASLLVRGRIAAPAASAVPVLGASLKLYAYSLFTTYLLPVQLIGFLLLIAMLGVIVISKKTGEGG